MSDKIVKMGDIQLLQEKLAVLKQEGKRIALAHGCFDCLHIGHIFYLKEAKADADVLIVSVTPDIYVKGQKGAMRPYYSEEIRMGGLAALGCVDYVVLNNDDWAVPVIDAIQPHIYAKGVEYKDVPNSMLEAERTAVESHGGELVFIDAPVKSSASFVLNRWEGQKMYGEELDAFLHRFRSEHPVDTLLTALDKIKESKVLVIGETIIDEYIYTSQLGVAPKSSVIARHYESSETMYGGAFFAALNAAQLAGQVTLLTMLGSDGMGWWNGMEQKMPKNMRAHVIYANDRQTPRKSRLIDGREHEDQRNMSELCYGTKYAPMMSQVSRSIITAIDDLVAQHDMIMVADFGHGMIDNIIGAHISKQRGYRGRTGRRFVSVMTQTNESNTPFNTLGKYGNLDCVILDDDEVKVNLRSPREPDVNSLDHIAHINSSDTVVMTVGRRGAYIRKYGDRPEHVPAFLVQNTVDRIGAGDAFYAVASQVARAGYGSDVIGVLGCLAGAICCKSVGTSQPVTRDELIHTIKVVMA